MSQNPDTRERIMEAARQVLGRFTLQKFSMEDVAKYAGIARQTVYKYFASRDDLIIALFVEEMRVNHGPRVTEAAEAREPSADALADLFMLEWQVSRDFALYAEMLDPVIAPRMAELVFSAPHFDEARLALWDPILSRYQDAGVVRRDLDHGEIVRWLTYQEFWFVTHPDTLCPDDEIEHFVRRMLIPALLSPTHFAETIAVQAART